MKDKRSRCKELLKISLKRVVELLSPLLCPPVDADILCYTPQEFAKLKYRGFLRRYWQRRLFYMRREPAEEIIKFVSERI